MIGAAVNFTNCIGYCCNNAGDEVETVTAPTYPLLNSIDVLLQFSVFAIMSTACKLGGVYQHCYTCTLQRRVATMLSMQLIAVLLRV